MTTTFQGMDTDGALALATDMRTAAGQLATKADAVWDAVNAVTWKGDDANEYRLRINSTALPPLRNLIRALGEFATELDVQRGQQQTASAASQQSASSGPAPSTAPGGRGTPRAMGERVIDSRITLAEVAAAMIDERLDPYQAAYEQPSELVNVTEHGASEGADSLADLTVDNHEARYHNGGGEDKGNIRVQEVRTASGETAYIVQIPPTAGGLENPRSWLGSQGNQRGWGNNLDVMAGEHTLAAEDVERAMQEFNVPKDAPVMLYGHSQGGLIASQLAANPRFNGPGGYNVTDVVTIGSPSEAHDPAQTNTQVSSIHHQDQTPFHNSQTGKLDLPESDPVAHTDLGGFGIDVKAGTVGFNKNPQIHDVPLPAHEKPDYAPDVFANHDNVGTEGSARGAGYHNSLKKYEHLPPVEAAEKRIDGVYMGDGVRVVRDFTYEFVAPSEPDLKKGAIAIGKHVLTHHPTFTPVYTTVG